MQSRDAGPRQPLTKEQDELRLRGLRALARLIARAHLAAGSGGGASRTGPQAEPPRKEDRHAG
ncbi:MAG: hypothetical protein F4052_05840 [Dehalococcoidia bacterium]|nr:hypothetical protein [Dehalococcoidia bacterium]MYK26454.1 hypothetical protein [Dehalococcoidia bacterium]